MTIEIKVPSFPESVKDGKVVCWHKRPGDDVGRDEIVADIETDKVVFEVPAPSAGKLVQIFADEGSIVKSGQPLAALQAGEVKKTVAAMVKPAIATKDSTVAAVTEAAATDEARLVTPSARRLIAEQQLDVADIVGSGQGGRILKDDVIRFLDQQPPAVMVNEGQKEGPVSSPVYAFPGGNRPEKREPMSRLRAVIADRLLDAQQSAAILTTFNEIDMQAVIDLRQRYRKQFEQRHAARLGFMSFFVKAVTDALKHFPDINASIDGDEIVYHGYYDIGIAVASARGLVVPVLRDTDQMTMAVTEQQITDFASRANEGRLDIEEMTGGTFTITNGGVFGSLLSTPIINPPQSAILGMHKIEKRAVVIADEIVVRPMMYVALSYDHRLIDGRGAVQFLVHIKQLLEDPARMLLEI